MVWYTCTHAVADFALPIFVLWRVFGERIKSIKKQTFLLDAFYILWSS